MAFRHWLSMLLTIVILFGVAISFRRLDFFLMDETKALISLIFGFATSCLLLTFVWLIQKRPSNSVWTMQHSLTTLFETPSMNPRGRVESEVDTFEEARRGATVCSISSMLDMPPNYEEALVTSKPVNNWTDLRNPLKISQEHQQESSGYNRTGQPTARRPSQESLRLSEALIQNPKSLAPTLAPSMAHLALSIVRGFTGSVSNDEFTAASEQNLNQHAINGVRGRRSRDPRDTRERRTSFCQLDVGQLITSGSPPKYCELSFGSNEFENTSNEPRAGIGC